MKAICNNVLIFVPHTEKETSFINGIYVPAANNNPVLNVVATGIVYDSDDKEFKKGDKIWIDPNLIYIDQNKYKPYIKKDNGFVFICNDPSWQIYLIERDGVLIPTKRWSLIKRMYIDADSIVKHEGVEVKLSKSGLVIGIGADKSVRMGKVFLSDYVSKDSVIFYSNKIGENLKITINNEDYLRVRNPVKLKQFNPITKEFEMMDMEDDILAIAIKN